MHNSNFNRPAQPAPTSCKRDSSAADNEQHDMEQDDTLWESAIKRPRFDFDTGNVQVSRFGDANDSFSSTGGSHNSGSHYSGSHSSGSHSSGGSSNDVENGLCRLRLATNSPSSHFPSPASDYSMAHSPADATQAYVLSQYTQMNALLCQLHRERAARSPR